MSHAVNQILNLKFPKINLEIKERKSKERQSKERPSHGMSNLQEDKALSIWGGYEDRVTAKQSY